MLDGIGPGVPLGEQTKEQFGHDLVKPLLCAMFTFTANG
jgi:hypothetical protein